MKQINKLKENYQSPTPVKFRMWGDFILLFCVLMNPVIMNSPLPGDYQAWAISVLDTLGVIAKILLNFAKTNENSN